ncbi:MAG TPA: MoxR family ATPase [Blastocatellia bacterium]|nr:MoxR family ATPase [Blastocatellia bacterium]
MLRRVPTELTDKEKSALLDQVPEIVTRLEHELARVIVGQREVIRQLLVSFLAAGHLIIEGVPGLAKTLIIRSLADATDLQFKRIQFTPDLMPSDIIGTEVIEEDLSTGKRVTRFIPGPLFANIILADEINRTPPKTQAALLEAMQEHQVTVGGKSYEMAEPFFVLATQNPIELEGTFALPEAELDRFMMKIVIDYPGIEEEKTMLARTTSSSLPAVSRVIDSRGVMALQSIVRDVPAATNIVDYAARLVRATRPGTTDARDYTNEWIKWGAGPRAGQALLLGAKSLALLDGRLTVSFDDVRSLARAVLRHRIIMNFRAEAQGITPDLAISRLLDEVKV